MSERNLSIVALDIETTSLEPAKGDIIEIAAVRFDWQTRQETGRFVRLIKPIYPISEEITALTGINAGMVASVPSLADSKDELRTFLGDSIILAHNASFDVGFLNYHGANLQNPIWDTLLLASIAWPQAPTYNLGTLARELQLPLAGEHRALPDALAGWHLLLQIVPRLSVTKDTYQTLTDLLKKADLEHYEPLFSKIESVNVEKAQIEHRATTQLKKKAQTPSSALILESIFSPKGVLAQHIPGFTSRPEQLIMAQTIEMARKEGKVVLIEAPPGTGKTYAYLAPALLNVNSKAKERSLTVISTHTKHLQDQLTQHDIPRLMESLGVAGKVVTLKGRRNYICSRRFEQLLAQPEHTVETAWILLKIILWLENGGTGDLENIHLPHQGWHILHLLHADSLTCRFECIQPGRFCLYQQRRAQARNADILITNHALLMQLAEGADFLSRKPHVIIDEAHHVPLIARQAGEIDFTLERVQEIIHFLQEIVRDLKPKRKGEKGERQKNEHLLEEIAALEQDYGLFLHKIKAWMEKVSPRGRLRLSPTTRRSQGWQTVVRQGQRWRGRLSFILGLLQSAFSSSSSSPSSPSSTNRLEQVRPDIEQFNRDLEHLLEGTVERIQWLELRPLKKDVMIYDWPLSIHPLIKRLIDQSRSVVLTSATLTINSTFLYIKRILGLENPIEKLLESQPFSYRDNMLIYITDDAPDPRNYQFYAFVADIIYTIARTLHGRTLGLCTSYAAIKNLHFILNNRLHKENIRLLSQNLSGGRHNILQRFKMSDASSVLLGTSSFWEGVDIPGQALSAVVIPKLPFPLPDDPVTEALSAKENSDPFTGFSLPQMILRLRQGVGRLLRSPTDKGMIVICDSRFLSSTYGQEVIQSLPPATVRIGRSTELFSAIENWFGQGRLATWQKGSPENDGKKNEEKMSDEPEPTKPKIK